MLPVCSAAGRRAQRDREHEEVGKKLAKEMQGVSKDSLLGCSPLHQQSLAGIIVGGVL